jgi:hypothetical protein
MDQNGHDECLQELCDVCGGEAVFDLELDATLGLAIMDAIRDRKVAADKVLCTVAKALATVALLEPGDHVTIVEHADSLEVQVYHHPQPLA